MTLYDPDQGLEQIAVGLKTVAFDPIPELNGSEFVRSAPSLPAGLVMPPPINYREAMRAGVMTLDFELWLLTGSSAGWEQQKNLWKYLAWSGSSSIFALVDANPSLGIVGADGQPRIDAHVMTARSLNGEEIASLETMGFGYALSVPVIVTNRS